MSRHTVPVVNRRIRALGVAAVVTALVSVWLMWRQMQQLVREHLAEVATLRKEHETALREANSAHHAETMAMIERFNARKAGYEEQIAAARAEVAELRASLASSELDNEAKQTRISALNKRVADLELEAAKIDAEVMNLPRRGLGSRTLDLSKLPLVYPIEERKQA